MTRLIVAGVCIAVMALSVWVLSGGLDGGNDDRLDSVVVVISYSGEWSGSYGDLTGTRSVDGSGTTAYVMMRPAGTVWSVSAVMQKSDDSGGMLTVSIEDLDGNVLKTSSTIAAYGVATVAMVVE